MIPHNEQFYKIDLFKESFGLENAFVQDESKNIYHTVKDRRNQKVIHEASRLVVDKLVLITSGNNGYSLASLAKDIKAQVVCIVDKNIPKNELDQLNKVAYHVIQTDLSQKILRPEEVISFARERNDEVIWDVTNGFEEGYGSLIRDILMNAPEPDYIVIPIGSGGLYVSLCEFVQRLSLKTRVFAFRPEKEEKSVADKLTTPWTPYAKVIEHYQSLGHTIFRLSESEIRFVYDRYKDTFRCEPSSSIVFAAPNHYDFKKEDQIIFVNTGRVF